MTEEQIVELAVSTSLTATKEALAVNANGDFIQIFLELFKILLPILLEILKDNR